MWVLVFINIMFNAEAGYVEPFIEAYYEFDTMEECFIGREILLKDISGPAAEYFPHGTQAVCINNGDKNGF